ncbi:GntR family transcriptional regulator [Aliikangiella sp. IMCC44632]
MNVKVTDRIKQDLSHQLNHYKTLPFRLTLGAIADYYSVSLTPVRLVVDELISENLLARKSNGRLSRIKVPEVAQEAQPVEVKQPLKLTSSLDEQVASDVVRLCFEQHSDYLREEATAKKYNTGRTIIRQVFSRLAGAGLIEHVPRCGWKVRSFKEKDMLDYLEIREILEVKALNLARPYLKQDDLKKFLSINIVGTNSNDSELDNDLHDYWIRRCNNTYIIDFFERHGSFYSALFDFASLGDNIKIEMAQAHRDILQSLIEQNWSAAEALLIQHIRDQRENVMQLIKLKKKV